jgi:thioredoxin reductase (NADPH)
VAVDDDPEVLSAVERDLRTHFGKAHRVYAAPSGAEALNIVRHLVARGTPVALVIADERMPSMSGTQLLAEVRDLVPTSCRVLLTAYADTEAAIRGINDVRLDHYLMKPWDPPEEHLFPVLDDLLLDWSARAEPPKRGLRLVGSRWSPACYEAKDFLSRNRVPYRWVDLDEDEPTRQLVAQVSNGLTSLPVLIMADGSMHAAPTAHELADLVGLQTKARLPFYDLVIVGAGPSGLAAAVYAASEGLRTLVVEQGAHGGQAGTSSRIENYLGFPSGLSGSELAGRATMQARRFGAELLSATGVMSIRREDPYRILTLSDGSEVSCQALVLAMGVSVRRLEATGAERFAGAGVYYGAAMTEAAVFRDQPVCVVGAGNSAGQGALFYARYASSVTILVRGNALENSMSQYLVDRIKAEPTIRVITGAEVDEVLGDDRVEGVRIRDQRGLQTLDVKAVFVFIGARPHTDLVRELADTDNRGFILTGPDLPRRKGRPRGWKEDRDPYLLETNLPGVFAVGDVRAGSGKRVAAAVGEGSACVSMVHAYLATV